MMPVTLLIHPREIFRLAITHGRGRIDPRQCCFPTPQVIEELGGRVDARDEQMVSGPDAGDVKQVPFGIDNSRSGSLKFL